MKILKNSEKEDWQEQVGLQILKCITNLQQLKIYVPGTKRMNYEKNPTPDL